MPQVASAEDNALMLQNNNGSLLTLTEIAARLDVAYGRLRGFAEVPGVAEFVGAERVPGVKGVRYHPEAEAQFRRLIQAQDEGVVTPRTARAYLQNLTETALAPSPQLDNAPDDTAIVPFQQSNNGRLLAVLERLADVTRAVLPVPDDSLLTAEQAAGLLACSPRAVSRYVRPVMRRKWRRSDVLGFIAGLGKEENGAPPPNGQAD